MPSRLIRRVQAFFAAITGSLAGRLVLGATIVIVIGLIAGAIALPTLYRNAVERRFDNELRHEVYSLVGKISEDGEGGLSLTDEMVERDYTSHLSGWYWQITQEGTVVLASDSLTGYVIPAEVPSERSDEGHFYNRTGPRDQRLRVATRVLG